ncbi:hypothetical protein GNF80_05795 [Clostridium perfringens]|nr:hypothetical protein [Clostridium perfringens]
MEFTARYFYQSTVEASVLDYIADLLTMPLMYFKLYTLVNTNISNIFVLLIEIYPLLLLFGAIEIILKRFK